MAKKAPARRPAAAGRTRRPAAGRTTAAATGRGGAAKKKATSRSVATAKPASRRPAPAAKKKTAASKGAAKKVGNKKVVARKPATAPRAVNRKKNKAPTKTAAKSAVRPTRKTAPPAKPVARPATRPAATRSAPRRRQGGTGDERTLSQTPETGRSVDGPTNPLPTRRSTGTAAGAGDLSHNPDLERSLRELRLVEELLPSPPSSLDMDRSASAARTGAAELHEALIEHTETGPELTAGDVDASWEDAATVGDEAPGGDNPTPDQDVVEEIGKALGVVYEDNEELKGADKIIERDRHRWELDPASSEDYKERE